MKYLLYDLRHLQYLLNINLMCQYQYIKKLYYICHIRQEEGSIGVVLIVGSVLLGD